MMKGLLKLFPSIILLLSCSISPPIIKEIDWDIKLVKDTRDNSIYESLSLFVNLYDEDSEEDIKEILLIDDNSGLHWELTRDNWDSRFGSEKWYGSNSIIMQDRSPIPRESIRLFVRDRAGESVETKIYITKNDLDADSYTFPELSFYGDSIKLINSGDEGYLFGYSDLGELLYRGELSGESSFKDIFGENRSGEELYFHVISKVQNQVLESGPWVMPTYGSE